MTGPLARRTSPEQAARGRGTLLVPIGSFEQHGPHLPLSSDTVVAEEVCRLAALARDVDVAPALAYSASGEHEGFAGLLSLGTDATASLLTELVRSARASWSRVVLVSGHGGNAEALARVARLAAVEGDDVAVWLASDPGGDAHAGASETSVLLAIDPGLVRPGPHEPGPVDYDDGRLRERGIAAVSANGVLGDPRLADAERGRRLLERWCGEVVTLIDGGRLR